MAMPHNFSHTETWLRLSFVKGSPVPSA
jgi:hypothetical protein